MQVRPYDTEEQGVHRVVRSILSWEACGQAARDLDMSNLMHYLSTRETAKVEDMVRAAVGQAQKYVNEMYAT